MSLYSRWNKPNLALTNPPKQGCASQTLTAAPYTRWMRTSLRIRQVSGRLPPGYAEAQCPRPMEPHGKWLKTSKRRVLLTWECSLCLRRRSLAFSAALCTAATVGQRPSFHVLIFIFNVISVWVIWGQSIVQMIFWERHSYRRTQQNNSAANKTLHYSHYGKRRGSAGIV